MRGRRQLWKCGSFAMAHPHDGHRIAGLMVLGSQFDAFHSRFECLLILNGLEPYGHGSASNGHLWRQADLDLRCIFRDPTLDPGQFVRAADRESETVSEGHVVNPDVDAGSGMHRAACQRSAYGRGDSGGEALSWCRLARADGDTRWSAYFETATHEGRYGVARFRHAYGLGQIAVEVKSRRAQS